MKLFSKIKLKDILRAQPVSKVFGFDRGTPVDRYYIEKFLKSHSAFISGEVLEIAENTYTQKFGQERHRSHILHYDNSNPDATIIGDLTKSETLSQNVFDCFICTQTYNFIYNYKDAISGSHFILKPGGVLLATTAFMSPISKYDADRWGDYWRFSPQTLYRDFTEVFGEAKVEIQPLGNSAAASLFMKGYALEEVVREVDLDDNDQLYPLIIGIKAVK